MAFTPTVKFLLRIFGELRVDRQKGAVGLVQDRCVLTESFPLCFVQLGQVLQREQFLPFSLVLGPVLLVERMLTDSLLRHCVVVNNVVVCLL